jgi:hypothetical protein
MATNTTLASLKSYILNKKVETRHFYRKQSADPDLYLSLES